MHHCCVSWWPWLWPLLPPPAAQPSYLKGVAVDPAAVLVAMQMGASEEVIPRAHHPAAPLLQLLLGPFDLGVSLRLQSL